MWYASPHPPAPSPATGEGEYEHADGVPVEALVGSGGSLEATVLPLSRRGGGGRGVGAFPRRTNQ